MKKILFVAAIAMMAMGCCKKAENKEAAPAQPAQEEQTCQKDCGNCEHKCCKMDSAACANHEGCCKHEGEHKCCKAAEAEASAETAE